MKATKNIGTMTTTRIAPGFYKGIYKGQEFSVTSFEDSYTGKITTSWRSEYITEIGRGNTCIDPTNTKAAMLKALKGSIDDGANN